MALIVVDCYRGVNRGEVSREVKPGVVNQVRGGMKSSDVTVEDGSIV